MVLNRVLGVLVVFASAVAVASPPPAACPLIPGTKDLKGKCNVAYEGDPVDMMNGVTHDISTDLKLNLGDGIFKFVRTFTSNSDQTRMSSHWRSLWPEFLASPYGIASRNTFWHLSAPSVTHSLESYLVCTHWGGITYTPESCDTASNVLIFQPEMFWDEFQNRCVDGDGGVPSLPCAMDPWTNDTAPGHTFYTLSFNRGTRARLRTVSTTPPRRYELTREDGEIWRYQTFGPTDGGAVAARLIAIDESDGRGRLSLTYAAPSACSGVGTGNREQIDRAALRGGQAIAFTYGTFNDQCVLTNLYQALPDGGLGTSLVTYQYGNAAGEVTGVLPTSVTSADGTKELYSFDTSSGSLRFTAQATDSWVYGYPRSSHWFDAYGQTVVSASGASRGDMFSPTIAGVTSNYTSLTGLTPPVNSCYAYASLAGGTSGIQDYLSTSLSESTLPESTASYWSIQTTGYLSADDVFRAGGQHARSVVAKCVMNSSTTCLPGTVESFFKMGRQSDGLCSQRDSFAVSDLHIRPSATGYAYDFTWRDSMRGPAVPSAEKGDVLPVLVTRGSSSPDAGDWLSYTEYNWPLGAGGAEGQQYSTSGVEPTYSRMYDVLRSPSNSTGLGSGQKTIETQRQPLPVGTTAAALYGWRQNNTFAETDAERGTINRKTRVCDTPGVTDPAGRVLSVEGPCWLNSSKLCDTSEPVPLTEYFYYGSSAAPSDVGRLYQVKRYPNRVGAMNASCGAPLVTTYSNYNVIGLPGTIVDEAGVSTFFTYTGDKIASRTTGGLTTSYSYEADGQLRWIQYPEGNYLVYCRRNSGIGACNYSSGVLTANVQWMAKSASSNGAGYTELVKYEYLTTSNILERELYYESGGVLRRQINHFTDPRGNETATTEGVSSSTWLRTSRGFDVADQLAAVGGRFAGSPEFCTGLGGSYSPLCAWITHDRLNRVAQAQSHPTGTVDASASIKTCIDYTPRGDISRVVQGCQNSATCAVNTPGTTGQSSCPGTRMDYLNDDFGNVSAVVSQFNGANTVSSTTKYSYNARGLVVRKETEAMRGLSYLRYTYDASDRLILAEHVDVATPAFPITLYAFGYDSGSMGSGCPTLANTGGRRVYRSDSFGTTWFSYNYAGQVVAEYRQRAGWGGVCTANENLYPHTTYSYTNNGNLLQVRYPYGRVVAYTYGAGTDRVTGVDSTFWSATPKDSRTLLTDVQWEPFGGLKSYGFPTADGGVYTVEYPRGGITSGDTLTNVAVGSACNLTPSLQASDGSNRVRAVLVTEPTQTKGNVLTQVYTWGAEELAKVQTCSPRMQSSAGTQTVQSYGYDFAHRLLSSSSTGNLQITNGPVTPPSGFPIATASTYGYDRRGNRSAYTAQGCARTMYHLAANAPDILTDFTPNGGNACLTGYSGFTWPHDKDGRVSQLWAAWLYWNVALNYTPVSVSGPLDSVYRSATVQRTGAASANYAYSYDAHGRRRLKGYPFDSQEEWFYDTGSRILTQRSGDVAGVPTSWTVDDYVWLDGKPLVMIRGSMTTGFARNYDTQASCTRFGEAGSCGAYQLIHDVLPKPIAMIQQTSGKIANLAIYDDFGHPNRIAVSSMVSATADAGTVLADMTLPQGTSGAVQYRARALFNMIDSAGSRYVTVGGVAEPSMTKQAEIWTQWMTPSSAVVPVRLQGGTGTCATSPCRGVQMESFEYLRAEVGLTPMWTTMRFPGQQYDQETDLFENWNRYYSPSTGRYFSPEPLLGEASWVTDVVRRGVGAPAYEYAFNNPTKYTDPDGREGTCSGGRCATTGEGMVEPAAELPAKVPRPSGLELPFLCRIGLICPRPKIEQECGSKDMGTCSCQHRDIFSSGGISCQTLRENGTCGGPYKGVGKDSASCQSNARVSADARCWGCLGHCQFRGSD